MKNKSNLDIMRYLTVSIDLSISYPLFWNTAISYFKFWSTGSIGIDIFCL